MLGNRQWLLAALLLVAFAAAAHAQPKWDVAAVGGITAVRAPIDEDARYSDDWLHTGLGGVSIGRYFTPHVKVELEAAATGTGTQFVQRFVTVPGQGTRYPIGVETMLSVRSVSAVATWQFFDNEWVHPFISGGVAADVDERREHVWHQVVYIGDPRMPTVIAPESRAGPHRTTVMRGLLGGGVKLYMRERAFFKADGRVTFDATRRQVAFRAGFGVDF